MPYYDYVCETCNTEFEVQQSIKDPPLEQCPHCLEKDVKSVPKRLISKSNFILIGGCWAKDKYSK